MKEHPEELPPEQILLRMKALSLIEDLTNTSKYIDLLSAEDILQILEQLLIFSRLFFSEEYWNLRYRNPEVTAGETNTSKDNRKVGTIESNRKFLFHRTIHPGNPEMVAFLEGVYAVISVVKASLISEGTYENVPYNKDLRASLIALARKYNVFKDESIESWPNDKSFYFCASLQEPKGSTDLRSLRSRNRRMGYNFRKNRNRTPKGKRNRR